jgi:hypothetical protein
VTQETNPNSFFNGGPSSEASARGSYSLSVGGSRANSTDWLLDGNDNNELTSGAISILSSIDSIQEFKVLTYNYSAEWGTRGGPTVLVTTKSGSDQFHGSRLRVLPQHRPGRPQLLRRVTEKFNLNQFGASLGGPIKKDKTFSFRRFEQKISGTEFRSRAWCPPCRDAKRRFQTMPSATEHHLSGPILGPHRGERRTRSPCRSCATAPAMPLPAAADGSQPAARPAIRFRRA